MATRRKKLSTPSKVNTMVEQSKQATRSAKMRNLLAAEEDKDREARLPSIRKMANELFSNTAPPSRKSNKSKPKKAAEGYKKGGAVVKNRKPARR